MKFETKYPFLPVRDAEKWEMIAGVRKVSMTARSEGGWFHEVKKLRRWSLVPVELKERREKFLSRTLAAYKSKPTFRRFISLIMWNYLPDIQFDKHGAMIEKK